MHIVSLVPEGTPSSLYRSYVPLSALAMAGHRVQIHETSELGDPAELRDVDVVHFFRLAGDVVHGFASQLVDDGVAVVWDNDFDSGSAPADHPVGVALAESGEAAEWIASEQQMLRLATLVTTPTEALAERYRAAGAANVEVLPNLLPPQFRWTVGDDQLTIGFAAMQEHSWDYEQLGIPELLHELLAERPELRVQAIGLDLGIDDPRCEQLPWQAYDRLPALLARCDVALAPLVDVSFNQTRSNVKLKEYAACGVPWLASPVGEYAALGEQQGGRLVGAQEWERELRRLLDDADARRRLGSAGRAWTSGDYVLDHVEALERVFARADDLSDL